MINCLHENVQGMDRLFNFSDFALRSGENAPVETQGCGPQMC